MYLKLILWQLMPLWVAFAMLLLILAYLYWPSKAKVTPVKPLGLLEEMREEFYTLLELSILQCPDEWVQDTYVLHNKTRKLSIWTANADKGLGLAIDGSRASHGQGDVPEK